ncbi:acyltransferase [Spirosoma harenae]
MLPTIITALPLISQYRRKSLVTSAIVGTKKRLDVLDYLKGVSIVSIILLHSFQLVALPPLGKKLIQFGGTGIHVFLFVSGFGLYLSHLAKPLSFGSFIKKRFLKIYIPVSLSVTVIALISLALPLYRSSWYAYLGHLFLYKMFDERIVGSYGYHFWFISLILSLYLAFLPILNAKDRLPTRLFIGLSFVISLAWSALIISIGKESVRVWNSFFLQYLWEFCLGIYLADRYKKKQFEFWNQPSVTLLLTSGVALLLYAVLPPTFGSVGKVLNDIPALVGYMSLAIFVYNTHLPFLNRFFTYTGKISFALYLFHMLFLQMATYIAARFQMEFTWLMVAISFGGNYLMAIYVYALLVRLYKVIKV